MLVDPVIVPEDLRNYPLVGLVLLQLDYYELILRVDCHEVHYVTTVAGSLTA